MACWYDVPPEIRTRFLDLSIPDKCDLVVTRQAEIDLKIHDQRLSLFRQEASREHITAHGSCSNGFRLDWAVQWLPALFLVDKSTAQLAKRLIAGSTTIIVKEHNYYISTQKSLKFEHLLPDSHISAIKLQLLPDWITTRVMNVVIDFQSPYWTLRHDSVDVSGLRLLESVICRHLELNKLVRLSEMHLPPSTTHEVTQRLPDVVQLLDYAEKHGLRYTAARWIEGCQCQESYKRMFLTALSRTTERLVGGTATIVWKLRRCRRNWPDGYTSVYE